MLVLNATSAVNFAHGDTVMAGGFLAVAMASLVPADLSGLGLLLLPGVLVVMAAFGLVLSWLAYMPLRRQPPVAVFISTIAVGIILANGANAIFGAAPRAAPPLFGAGQLHIGTLIVGRQALAIIVVAAVLIAALGLLLGHTQPGRKLRATAQDPEMARALGIDVTAMIGLSFALATAFAGAAGLLLANQFFITPSDGGPLMLKAYIAVVIGGWGSLRGAVVGALLIALFEVVVAAFVSHPVAEGGLFVAVLAILLLRPQGVFGEAAQRRA